MPRPLSLPKCLVGSRVRPLLGMAIAGGDPRGRSPAAEKMGPIRCAFSWERATWLDISSPPRLGRVRAHAAHSKGRFGRRS